LPSYATMIPTLVPEPFRRDGWIYEEKADGWRILAYKDGARVRLLSRTGVGSRQAVPRSRRGDLYAARARDLALCLLQVVRRYRRALAVMPKPSAR